MKNLLLTLFLTTFIATAITAQCDNFDCAYKAAQRLLNSTEKDKYTKAIAQLEDAENYAGSNKRHYKQVRALRKKMFKAIEKERKNAVEARSKAEIADNNKTSAILDKVYFYNGNLGLAYDKNTKKYGLIDKNLNTKVDFKYTEAFSFDYTGFAKVKKESNIDYLIDTTGKEYTLATNESELINRVAALDLRNKRLTHISFESDFFRPLSVLLLTENYLTSLPPEITKLTNLRMLYLSDNQLTSLPTEIGKLISLNELYLDKNQLMSLPPEIGALKNLAILDLSDNPIPPAEQEKIRKLLPNCKIQF